jgi:hypothetical protein
MISDDTTLERPKFTRGDTPRGNVKPSGDPTRSNQGYHYTGPYSRWLTEGGSYSGRSREGRFLNACRKELEDHLGGNLSVAQKILVERICFLRLRAALFDEQFLDTRKPLGELDYRVYMAISNSLVRATRELGVAKRPKSNGHDTADVLAELEEIDPR